jgi:hypothetical protein
MLPDWFKIELAEKWERLQERVRLPGLRRWVNEHPTAVISAATASAVLLLIVLILHLIPERKPQVRQIEKEWYYDLNTGQLFTGEKGLTPPIEAPSGPLANGKPSGVRAYVVSYVSEPNESERFVALLETTAPPDVLARWPSPPENASAAQKWGWGKLISRPDEERWVPAETTPGQELFEEAFAPNDNGERPTYCRPE